MGKARTKTIVLDAGALIAFERGDARMRALFREGNKAEVRFVVPAGVIGQVIRDTARQVTLRAVLNSADTTVAPLDRTLAEAAGVVCGRAGTSDVIDATLVLIARRERGVIVTSDVNDLARLDPAATLERI